MYIYDIYIYIYMQNEIFSNLRSMNKVPCPFELLVSRHCRSTVYSLKSQFSTETAVHGSEEKLNESQPGRITQDSFSSMKGHEREENDDESETPQINATP